MLSYVTEASNNEFKRTWEKKQEKMSMTRTNGTKLGEASQRK